MKGPRPLSASPRSSAARRYSQARIIWVGLLTLAIVCCCAAALSLRKAQALNAVAPSPQETHAASARMGDVAGIRAAGRGGPAVRLADGRDVLADYEGEPSLVQALGQAEPLGLASADFDEDGVPDLVGGYANGANGTDGGGLVTLHRGNAGALYPNSPEAQRRSGGGDARVAAPFLSPARVFAAPARFDFIGAGDFDGDGHRDVVGAGLGRRSLYLLAGDGKGNLSAAREIALPGALTALTTGEMNRPDGLADVLVGVESGGRAQVLVFEGPRGALKASPETFRMPARVNSLALAQFDDGYESDLVAAAGDQLVLVRGRDRKLSVARLLDEPVPEAEVTRRSFSTAITSLAAGDFDGEPQTELALLFADGSVHVLRGGAAQVKEQGTSRRGIAGWRSEVVSEPGLWAGATRVLSAKVSSAKGDDLLLLDAAGRQVHILKGRRAGKSPVASLLGGNGVPGGEAASLALSDGGPVAVLPMQLNVDALTDLVVLREGHSAPAVVLTENYGEEGTNKPAARTPQVNFTTGARLDAKPTATGYPQNVQPRSKPGATAAPIQQREVKQKVRKGDDSIKPLGACGAPPDPITVGQTINGTLTTSDCALQDGSYFDEYRFNGTAGQQIAVELNSADFDSFLYLLAPDGSLLEVDDDSGGGTDSRIPSEGGFFSLPSTGAYTIYATSFHAEDTGAYTLTLAAPGSGQCPSTHLASGQIFNGALSSTDCFFNTGARNGSFVDIYTFDGRAGQEAIVEMARTSTTIDPYLILISPDEDLPALEDDDSGGNFDARIPSTGTVFLPFNGVYTIYATSFSANETGSYQVRVTLGAPPVASTVVTNTNDSGAGSLRQALLNANSNVGVDTVSFQIGSGARTINLLTELPEITDPVVIDGATQPGFAGTPLIELDGQFTPRGTAGLKITAGGSRVRGLAINRFGVADCFAPFDADIGVGTPIILSQGGGNIIEGNYLGTNQAGTAVACNSGNGVYVFNSSNNVIGGTTAAARNVISGNRFPGIRLGGVFTNGNHIQGNFFGTDATGNADLGNQSNGVAVIDGTNNVVGGTTAGAGNLISGNDSPGVALGFSDPSGILVQANFIGTNAAGNSALPNDGGGIIVGGFFQIDGSPITATDNTIGGTVPGAGNLISGNNGNGIEVINEGSQDNKVQGNFIGTNLAGTAAVANTGSGVFITDAPNNVIGIDDEFDELLFDGTNLISGNVQYGVGVGILRRNDANPSQFITGGDRMLVVLNVIGTDINLNPLGNGLDGVFVDADSVNNRIRFNIIAFNGGSGVRIPDNGNRSGFQINLETNYIYSNNGIGIDLGPAGVTPNDPGDTDGGANLQQNFPDLTAPTLAPITLKGEGTNAPAGTINVSGALSTTAQAGRTYTVHWYFSAGGQCSSNEAASRPRAFGIVPNVTTDAQGRAPFSFPLDFPTDVTSGIVNCTATDAQGNTSEFSACIPVTDAPSTSCATIFPTVQAFNASAGTGRLTVSAPPGCAWTATSNAPWLSVTAGVSGSGTGRVRYSVTANTTSATRIGTLTVAGLTYTVTQTANATTPTIQFSSATYPANEGDPARAVAVTLTRTGDTAGAASVEYATLDDPAPVPCNPLSQPDPGQPPFPRGTAYARCDYVTTIDRLTFAPGEMTKSFLVPLINDVHQDGTETFQLGLRNPEGATLGSRSTAAVTLADDDAAAPTTNPINTTPFFVRMQYLDFLSREPEAGEPWTGVLNGCPNPFNLDAGADSARCDRIIVSQSFFGSPEFQLKGFFVFLYYRATYGLQFLPEYGDITADMRRVTAATDAELVAKRFDFAEDWVQRADFLAQYPANQTNQQYVDRLMDLYNLQQITTEDPANPDGTAQVTLTRAQLVAQLTAGTLSRAQVLRALVQSNEANAREFNNAFVAMQYYGYLRRRPEAEGYAGWLDAIGRRGVSSRVMVDGFMNSAEYRLRFGPNTQ